MNGRPNDRLEPVRGSGLPITAILVAASAAGAGLGYVWTAVTGRLLPAAEYADFSAAASIIYFAATATAPCAQTLAYFTATYSAAGDLDLALALERRAIRVFALATLLALLVVAAVSSPLAALLHFRSQMSVVLAAVAAVSVGALHVKRGRLLGQQQFRRYAWNVTAESAVRLLVAVLLLFRAASAASSISAYILSMVAAMAWAGWPKGASRNIDMAPIRRYFVPVFAYTIIYAGFQNIDVLIVKRLFSPAEAGMYGAASFLSRAAAMLVIPFIAFAVPHLVEARADDAEVRRRFARIVAQYSILAAVSVAAIGLGSRIIISLLFGPEYRAAAALLLPLSAAIALSGLVFLLCQLPVAMNRFQFVKWYAGGLLVEVAAVAGFHRTLLDVPMALIVTNVITLALVLPSITNWRGGRAER